MTTFQQALIQRLAKNKKRKQNGFTLVELMVVIVIVGILSAVALPQLTQAQNRAKDSVAKSELVAAGKDCSMLLLIDGDGTDFDASRYESVADTSTCETGGELTASHEDSDTEFTLSMSDDGLPGPAEVKGS